MPLSQAIRNLEFSRKYVQGLIDTVPEADWFRMPTEGVTHLAWQVGHLAMADYRLGLERLRGGRPEDEALISTDFLALFGRDSSPDADPAKYPPLSEIKATYERVRRQLTAELPTYAALDLNAPPEKPHSRCATKIECLFWCSQHEMLHGGQIGLLRRLLGAKPIW